MDHTNYRTGQTYYRMSCFVSLSLEVEIVLEGMISALVRTGKNDRHLELTPPLLLDAERGFLECCAGQPNL